MRIPGLAEPVTRLRLHHSGVRPVRVVLIGDCARLTAAGAQVTLAQRAVDRIWLTARRGVDLDALSDLDPVLRRVSADGHDWRLWRYDAVVVLLDPHASPRRREQAIDRVRDLLAHDAEHGTPLVLLRGGRSASSSEDAALHRAADAGGDALHVVESGARDDRAWAALIGEQVDAVVRASGPVAGPDDEAARQRALDDTGIVGRDSDPRLDDLVQLARSAFGAASAEINFIDRDRQWKLAVAGGERGENPRAHSFCNETIKRPEPLVVGDARLHPVLRLSPLVLGPRPIRFYAAHPIESSDGHRIGSFCVYDPEPRDVRGLDLAVLRDLALLAQAELIAQDTAPRGLSMGLRS